MTDLLFIDHGSIIIMFPRSSAGIEWIAEHIPSDATRWGRDGVVIEPRYVSDIVEGAVSDGLEISF